MANIFSKTYSKLASVLRSKEAPSTATPRVFADDVTVWPWSNNPGGDLAVSAVYACVKFISESVASLPLQMFKRVDNILVRDKNSRLEYVLARSPHFDFSAFDFWRQVVMQMLMHGNAYILPQINSISGAVDWLTLCTPHAVTYDKSTRRYTVNDTVNGIVGQYHPSEIIHIRNICNDGRVGLSVVEYARKSIDIAKAGDSETLKRFRSGGNVKGFFTNGSAGGTGFNPMVDSTLKEMAKAREEFFRNGGNMTFLPGAMQFKELIMSSADMQFLESRKFTVTEICRYFGVDPSLVYATTNSNYKSVELANAAFLSHTLNPLLLQIEQELMRKLMPWDMSRELKFDRTGLLECDLETKARLVKAKIESGMLTVNEARRAENLPPIAEGDTLLVSANLKSISELANGSDEDLKGKEDGEGN